MKLSKRTRCLDRRGARQIPVARPRRKRHTLVCLLFCSPRFCYAKAGAVFFKTLSKSRGRAGAHLVSWGKRWGSLRPCWSGIETPTRREQGKLPERRAYRAVGQNMLTFWTRIERSMLRNSRQPSMPSLIFAMSVHRRNRQNRSLRPWTLKALWSSFRSRRSWRVRSQP